MVASSSYIHDVMIFLCASTTQYNDTNWNISEVYLTQLYTLIKYSLNIVGLTCDFNFF